MLRRRHVVIGGALAAWVLGVPRLQGLLSPEPEFEPIPGLPGFRSLTLGNASASPESLALMGISEPGAAERRAAAAAAPCTSLFGALPDDRLPVAVFTDYFCPYCPEVSDLVRQMEREGAPIRVIWREWPVLGPRSDAVARVALAAAEQGAHDAVHAHLMHSMLRPGPAAMTRLAEAFGLDPERLARDAAGEGVRARIADTEALAAVLGLPGTPGLAIGRTVTAGRIDKERLEQLIELERQRPPCRD